MKRYPISMIISGGQTGADRAALKFAIAEGIPHGGWCPKGRRAEDGVVPLCFMLQEASSGLYQQRTRLNVRDSDATLIIHLEHISRGTLLTVQCSINCRRPWFITGNTTFSAEKLKEWLWRVRPSVLNVAGPRSSHEPGIERFVIYVLGETVVKSDVPAPGWPPVRQKYAGDLFVLSGP